MRSATFIAAAVAMATSVSAQIDGFAVFAKPATDESVPAGKPYEITWAAGKYSGPAVISLIGGEDQGHQVPIKEIATIPEVGANKYTWNVDCSLGKAKVYGMKIALVNDEKIWQWSNRFHIDNSAYCAQDGSSASSSASASATGSASVTGYPTGSASASATSSVYPTTSAGSSSAVHTSSKPTVTATESHSAPVQTMSSSTKAATPSTTGGSNPIPTAAGSKVAAGSLVLAGVAAAAALAL